MNEPMKRIPWWIKAIVTAGLAILGTLYSDSKIANRQDQTNLVQRVETVESRQNTLEAHQQDNDKALNDKVDHMQQQVDKLVEWALGHK